VTRALLLSGSSPFYFYWNRIPSKNIMEGRYGRCILVLVLALMLMMLGADAQDKKKKGPKVLKAKKLVPYIKCDACKAFGICINI
jgi:hypothetical protein